MKFGISYIFGGFCKGKRSKYTVCKFISFVFLVCHTEQTATQEVDSIIYLPTLIF